MSKKQHQIAINDCEPNDRAAVHVSFVLRCQINNTGQVRLRLVDVRTERIYILDELEGLPEVLSHLIQPLMRSEEMDL